MSDLNVFLDNDFDPKRYINEACGKRPDEQAIERYLVELEMKLHLGAEDINLYLQDQSTRAAQRIPLAARELARIQEDTQSVRSAVSSTLSKLHENDAPGTVSSALVTIAELDAVKSRMDSACTTLKEATGLSTLFHLVDDLFKAGDLPRIADALAGIRRGLSIVADTVPEFRDGTQRLTALEDRLATAAEKPLADALRAQRGDESASLSSMLIAIHRSDIVSRIYVSSRSKPLHVLWDEYKPGTPFASWMSTFYDQLLRTIVAEWEWCHTSLPESYPSAVVSLLNSFFDAIDKPLRARLAGALTGAPGSIMPLEHLEHTAKAAETFLNDLNTECVLRNITSETVNGLLQRIAAPLEGALGQYPDKEFQYLSSEIQTILQKAKESAVPPLDQSLSTAYTESIDHAFTCFYAALDRCSRITQCTLLPMFVRSVDRALYQYISAMHTSVMDVYTSNSSDRISGGGNNTSGQQQQRLSPRSTNKQPSTPTTTHVAMESTVPLLLLSSKLNRKIAAYIVAVYQMTSAMLNEQALNTTMNTNNYSNGGSGGGNNTSGGDTQQQQQQHSGISATRDGGVDNEDDNNNSNNKALSSSSITFATLRLHSQPNLKQQLTAFYTTITINNNNSTPSDIVQSNVLPQSIHVLQEFTRSIESLVESSMTHRIKPHLYGIANLSEWKAQPSSTVPLPSFTPYPLQYITATGETLMLLPQVLESALTTAMMTLSQYNTSNNNGGTGSSRQNSMSLGGDATTTTTISSSSAGLLGGGSPRSSRANRQDSLYNQLITNTDDDADGEEVAQLVAEWVDRVALSTAKTYQSQLAKIQSLSEQGAMQLVADIEYFCNVLSTLGLSAPPVLAAWQAALLAQNANELKSVVELLPGDGGAESRIVVEMVGKLKGFGAV